jgi:hypothetical protein
MVLKHRKVILINWHLEWLLLVTQWWQGVGDVLWARLRIGRKNVNMLLCMLSRVRACEASTLLAFDRRKLRAGPRPPPLGPCLLRTMFRLPTARPPLSPLVLETLCLGHGQHRT